MWDYLYICTLLAICWTSGSSYHSTALWSDRKPIRNGRQMFFISSIRTHPSIHTAVLSKEQTFVQNICLLGWGRQTTFNTTYWSLCMYHHHLIEQVTWKWQRGHHLLTLMSLQTGKALFLQWKGRKSIAHESYKDYFCHTLIVLLNSILSLQVSEKSTQYIIDKGNNE